MQARRTHRRHSRCVFDGCLASSVGEQLADEIQSGQVGPDEGLQLLSIEKDHSARSCDEHERCTFGQSCARPDADRPGEAPPLAALPAPKKRLSKSRPHRGGKCSSVYRIALCSLRWRRLHVSMASSRRPNSDDSDSRRRPSDGGLRPGSFNRCSSVCSSSLDRPGRGSSGSRQPSAGAGRCRSFVQIGSGPLEVRWIRAKTPGMHSGDSDTRTYVIPTGCLSTSTPPSEEPELCTAGRRAWPRASRRSCQWPDRDRRMGYS
jgi:hypothetical protein